MSTDFRALCAELADVLAELPFGTCEELVVRARAALASPGSGLPQRPESFEFALDFLGGPENDELLAYVEQLEARAALMADGPASVMGKPSDQELAETAMKAVENYRYATELSYFLSEDSSEYEPFMLILRAVLARWGHQPAPPAAGEVGELVAWLRAWALGTMEEGQPATSRSLTRAADLLAQRHPEPVPVAERLPGSGDCDGEGRCWLLGKTEKEWRLIEVSNSGVPHLRYCFSHWLPAHALPLPAGEVGHG